MRRPCSPIYAHDVPLWNALFEHTAKAPIRGGRLDGQLGGPWIDIEIVSGCLPASNAFAEQRGGVPGRIGDLGLAALLLPRQERVDGSIKLVPPLEKVKLEHEDVLK